MSINLEESSTYRLIIAEGQKRGKQEGRLEVARDFVVRQGRLKFGPPTPQIESTMQEISDLDRLGRMADRILSANGWDDLLATT